MIAQAIVVVVVAAGAAAARRAGRFGFSVFARVTSAAFVYTLSLPFSSLLSYFLPKNPQIREKGRHALLPLPSTLTLSATISCTRRVLAKPFVRV
jgi:hypothetical protein